MRRGSRLVNTSRGALIDEAALVEALRDGIIAGAALDVFEVQRFPASEPVAPVPAIRLSARTTPRTRLKLMGSHQRDGGRQFAERHAGESAVRAA